MSHLASHGRGGAGNMVDASKSPQLQPTDLETPTLKTPVVTTGRGGSGNMARNNDPVETRLRQDVQGTPRRPSHGAHVAGRGGAGNVFQDNQTAAELELGKNEKAVVEDSDSSNTELKKDKLDSLAAKSKGWFLGKKA